MSKDYYNREAVDEEAIPPPPSYASLYQTPSPSAPPVLPPDKQTPDHYGTIEPYYIPQYNIPDAPEASAPPLPPSSQYEPAEPPLTHPTAPVVENNENENTPLLGTRSVSTLPSIPRCHPAKWRGRFDITKKNIIRFVFAIVGILYLLLVSQAVKSTKTVIYYDYIPTHLNINNTVHIHINSKALVGNVVVRTLDTPLTSGWIETKITARDIALMGASCHIVYQNDETTLTMNLPNGLYPMAGSGIALKMTVWLPMSAKTITFDADNLGIQLDNVVVQDKIVMQTSNAPIQLARRSNSQELVLTTSNNYINSRAALVQTSKQLQFVTSVAPIYLGPINADNSLVTFRTTVSTIQVETPQSFRCRQLEIETRDASLNLEYLNIDATEKLHVITYNGHISLGEVRVSSGDVNLRTKNGIIQLAQVNARDHIEIATANAAVNANLLQGRSITVTTSLGSIQLGDVQADELVAKTSGGSLLATLSGNDFVSAQLTNSNGRIEAFLPYTFVGELDVQTSNSAAQVRGKGVQLDTDEYAHKHGRVGSSLPGIESGRVVLKTSNSGATLLIGAA